MIDKEFFRLWFANHCDPYGDEPLPKAPDDLIATLSERYIQLYERITGKGFERFEGDIHARLRQNITTHLID